jgi:hypothetical protein
MSRKLLLLPAIGIMWLHPIFCQQTSPRELPAKRTNQKVTIDGLLNEPAWKDAAIMNDLVEFRPTMGKKESHENRSEMWLMYDDAGIYFGGYCHERTRDSIASELVGRDGFGTNDYVGLIFDTYADKLNGFEYFVTPLNEQWDSKMNETITNGNSEDFSWNAVWESGAVIHEDGWTFEMFIPYSAIRFGKKEVQNWGMNITRRRRKTDQQYTWNPINVNVKGFLSQEGLWTGITNIKPPLRLQFSPYFSVYANHYPHGQNGIKNWTSQVNGGMDVKYGINQAFTLDMTLIPDFGQVQSDNKVLNLTPFEVKYNENRPFFTEGTELFSKGNLFFSRRIGIDQISVQSLDVGPNEKVIREPLEAKLINATKLSGRTSRGLGIGVLNAVTNNSYAIIENTTTKEQRKALLDPLTNFSVIVLDQTMGNNSSVSLVNTNVWRSGSAYDANVTAGLFNFNNSKNTWNVSGKFANSRLIGYNTDGSTKSGYSHNISFGKTSGRFNFNFVQDLTDTKFNSNDLSYFTFNNYVDHSLWVGYRWVKPTSWYNNIRINFNTYYSRNLTSVYSNTNNNVKLPGYRSTNINVNANGQLKNLWFVGAMAGYEPRYNDFNEPRTPGRFFRGWTDWFVDAWFETNASKKYSFYAEMLFIKRSLFNSRRYMITFNQRFRFSDKFSISHRLNAEPQTNNTGFAAFSGTDIIFGRRDRNTIENILNFKYNFNSRMGLNLRLRHYWSKVEYKEFFTLIENGELAKNTAFNENRNQNVNFFNVDMVYTWQFAPGSFINIVWKDAGFVFSDQVERDYFKNFNNTINTAQNNNLSLKVIYFLDYLNFKKWKNKKKIND